MQHTNERRFFIRGREGKPVFVNPIEYRFRFAFDAVEKKGEVIGYVHQFYDDYIAVLPNLVTLCFRPTEEAARKALVDFCNKPN